MYTVQEFLSEMQLIGRIILANINQILGVKFRYTTCSSLMHEYETQLRSESNLQMYM